MSLFIWYKTYSVNNEELDNHHKALLDIINRLHDNCFGKDNTNCLDPIVEELVSYSSYHFTAEEQHMRNIGYKDIERHIVEHNEFAQKILRLQQVVNKNDFELTKELIVYIGNWICNHVLVKDKKYSVIPVN
jgi:hemerythrin